MYNKRYSLALKTGCFLLLLVALVAGVAGGVAACYLADQGAYTLSREDLLEQGLQQRCSTIANNIAQAYAQEHLGSSEEEIPSYLYEYTYDGHWQLYPQYYKGNSNYRYEIRDESGKLLHATYQGEAYLAQQSSTVQVTSILDVIPPSSDPPSFQEDLDIEYGVDTTSWYRKSVNRTYSVTGYVLQDMAYDDTFSQYATLVGAMYQYRFVLVVLVCVCLAALLCLTVYLLSAAGRRPDQEGIFLNPLDRLPGDLYLAVIGTGLTLLVMLFDQSFYWDSWITLVVGIGCLIVGGILVMAALLSLATRVKYGKGYWWRHSIIGYCLLGLLRGCRCLLRGIRSVFRMLPVIWKWLLISTAAGLLTLSCLNPYTSPLGFLIVLALWAFLTVYPAWSLGKLRETARRMAQGNLQEKLDTTHLHGSFRQIAQDLNALSQGASLAVERQLKSERMKTELITNVSHDIKTPLTSIVNYVDLLQKPHTPAEGAQYLEVLARQSQRLKKLTEDLVEMSKASSGNIPVNLAPVNVVELVNQALAEYEEKLERANLPVILTAPQPEILVSADGRLFWRVMDNLLGNCVKYAQAGTRVYVDVVKYEKKVMISMKNISRAELNLPADELMERFVRGDSARNTEGSGLGLNIAKTLMTLQKGKLNLVIDGDLFKAVLLFDCLPPAPDGEPTPQSCSSAHPNGPDRSPGRFRSISLELTERNRDVSMSLSEKKKKRLLTVIIVLSLIFMGLVTWFVGKPLVQFAKDPNGFRAWVNTHGIWGRVLYVGMIIFQVLVALIPGEPLEIAGGYAFGAWEGTLLCLLGATLGSTLVFLLVRRWGVRVLELYFPREKIESLKFMQNTQKVRVIAFLLMFIPGTPKDLISYCMGLTKIKLSEWILLSTVARIPSIVTSTVGGDALGGQDYRFAILVFAGTLVISLIGGLIYNVYTKRHSFKAGVRQQGGEL